MKHLGGLAIMGLLAGCAATMPPADDRPPTNAVKGSCRSEPGQAFVGQKASGELGRAMMDATGAAILRWVPPRTAVTMDFNPSRLTVGYNDDYVVTRVSCT